MNMIVPFINKLPRAIEFYEKSAENQWEYFDLYSNYANETGTQDHDQSHPHMDDAQLMNNFKEVVLPIQEKRERKPSPSVKSEPGNFVAVNNQPNQPAPPLVPEQFQVQTIPPGHMIHIGEYYKPSQMETFPYAPPYPFGNADGQPLDPFYGMNNNPPSWPLNEGNFMSLHSTETVSELHSYHHAYPTNYAITGQ